MAQRRASRQQVGRQRPGRRRATALLVTMGLALAACDDGGGSTPTTSGPSTTQPGGGDTGSGPAPRLFGLQLSEGEALAAPAEPTAVVPGEGLDQAALDAIIARLPQWLGGGAQEEPFNWPVQSSPPPRTGETIDEPFPPTDTTTPEEVPTGPLQVLRFQPEGDVPIAPYVAITFNQPMVPVGTVAQVNAADVPATILPALAGQWQWIGTRTLRFDASSDLVDRLPMATTFTVTVPAGTTSATGGELAAAVSFQFTTPPPTVQSFSPGDGSESLARDQLFIATFDQRIDSDAVLATVHLRAGDQQVAVRLATAAEVAADDSARNISETAEEGRWLAFRPIALLPTDTALTIDIGPGTPSAEGPGTTTSTATFRGRTYPPLTIKSASCSYSDDCPPGSDLYVTFSNPLDGDRSSAAVTVSPAIAGMSTGVQYDSLLIHGATLARTEYTITVPGSFTDVFGQTLGSDQTVKVRVGSAQPSLGQYEAITTLDPFADGQTLSVLTVNHDQLRVRVFAADPAEFATFLKYNYERDYNDTALPSWTVLSDQTITVAAAADTMVDTPIDLSGVLQGKPGQVIVLVEPVPAVPPSSNDYWQNRPSITWVQSTHLGIDVLADHSDAQVWATDLRTGAPVQGVSLAILPGSPANTATTDADGLATVRLTDGPSNVEPVLVATKGDETAVLPLGTFRQAMRDEARWYVFDDRQVYRPGETMRVKGWVRRIAFSDDGTLRQLTDGDTVRYTVSDSYGNEIAKGDATVGSLGGFDLRIEVPETANVGSATLAMTLVGEAGLNGDPTNWHSFQIQEYRTPEFEVTARPESEGPYLSTQPATVAATGTYYAGGPLVQSAVDWLVTTTTATYSPPGWDDFTFGIWQPWWYGDLFTDGYSPSYASDVCCGPVGETTTQEYHGVTDGAGTHYLRIDFEAQDGTLPDLPVTVNAQATINDVNRQAWSAGTGLLVHAADRYVGLRSSRTFVRQGDPLNIEVIVAGIDGEALSGVTLAVVAGRLESKYVNGEWTEVVVDEQTCEVTTTREPGTCTFDTSIGGQYKVTAVVADADGGHNRTELTTWVSGATSQPTRGVQQQELTVVPNQATYAAGDTAELLVQAPFATGEGMLTVAHNGLRDTIRFEVAGGSAVVQVPITEADVPQLSLYLEVVGAAPRMADDGTALPDAPLRPAYAVGSMTLSVPPVARTLDVVATPRAGELSPGESTTIDVSVHDAAGRPVQGAEFAVVVVDEAVLALSGYQLPDPLGVFYAGGYEYLSELYSRAQIRLVDPARLDGSKDDSGGTDTTAAAGEDFAPPATSVPEASDGDYTDTPGDNAAGGSGGVNPIDVRSNFDALALFQPSVVTDADGSAAVDLTLPDNLTRYRVMVVAVSGADRFGSAESNITARLPLAVRPSAPRFANFGDTFELPVVLQNQSDAALTVQVVLETANLAQAGATAGAAGEGATGRTVTVPANDRVEVRFPVSTMQAGTAAFRVTAISGDLADSATVLLPVYTPTTAEAFATYGVIDADVNDGGAIDQPLLAPTDVVPGFGGLEITTSSTSLQALTDAVLYLSEYPYDSSDGRASRIIAIASLADVLDAFDAEGLPSQATIDATMKADVAALVAMQNDDGGFPYWQKYRRSEPFNTIQATHALLLARERGYSVPQYNLDIALQHLADIEQHIPSEYSQQQRDVISAYALWVRDVAGQGDAGKARRLYQDRGDELTVDALAWLWSTVDDASIGTEIERTLNNRAVETAGAANFVVDYGDSAYLTMHSDRRTDGIVLDALIANTPDSDLIPKVVTGLLANRVKGRWENVQENGFILLALRHYFDEFETQTPDFVARVWLGQQFAGEHAFQGRETDRARITIPTSELIAAGDTDLVLAKDGTGRLYYRIGLRYAPVDLQLDALDRGFVVQRNYEAVDDPADVTRDADGTWHVKAGARVRVTLTMVAESQRTHVALIDPLPAGFESLNPALAVTQTTPAPATATDDGDGDLRYDDWGWWWGQWYEHEQLRTDRTEAFTTFLPAGTYTYSYIARATTPGSFVVPPTRAEEMYAPETFGRAATDRVIVE
ncbi:MAG: alpha-2-macroglobulin family protein [Actinomycetota bacterium]|nr:alpha-2-macroglobulin family protein [Actinomycetota bacterium]